MSEKQAPASASKGRAALTVLAWLWVIVPFGYGGWQLLVKVGQLFSG